MIYNKIDCKQSVKLAFSSIRPKHWAKNLIIFAGPFFSLKMFDSYNFSLLILAFIAWCLISSAVYLLNDIIDRKQDSLHPDKKTRPIASGLLDIKVAYALIILLSLLSMTISIWLSIILAIIIVLYFLINIIYSIYLKHKFVINIFCISFGFILRLVSGAVIIHVGLSRWIIICTLLLALLLSFSKRQLELISLGGNAAYYHMGLKDYNKKFIKYIPYVLVSSLVVYYTLYTVSHETIRRFGTRNLIYTIPFVIYGLFRYIYLAYIKKKGSDPIQIVLQDLPSVINILLWITIVGVIIYLK